jgi:glycosyltransferase involved in cell wall biosynthesis
LDKIKIMRVITQLPVGGVERTLSRLLPKLKSDSFRVMVCCTDNRGELAQVLEEAGIPVSLIRLRSRWDPVGICKLARQMRREQIQVVHTHMYASSISGVVAAKLAKVPVIIANIHSLHEWHTKRRVWIAAKLFSAVDRVVAVSDCIRQDLLQKLELDPQKVVTIHNGIDLPRFDQSIDGTSQRRQLGIGDDELVIGAIGRLVRFKGFNYLLEAARIINLQWPKFKLVIVGGGELKHGLKQQAQELGIAEKVIFTGRQEDVFPFLAGFDIMVISSITEGLPIASLEAMAMGKAVVASRVGGIPEVVEDGVSGLLVPPRNPESLAQAVIDLLKKPELRKSMGQAGRARVEKLFSIQRVCEQTAKLYKDLLKQKGISELSG